MPTALNLTIRNPIDVMGVVADFFSGEIDREITFEGDVSTIDWAAIPGATVREDLRLAIVPLTKSHLEVLIGSVFPRIGLRSRVWHVTVRHGELQLFASYDSFGSGMVVVEAPERDLLCARLQAAGLVVERKVVMIDD